MSGAGKKHVTVPSFKQPHHQSTVLTLQSTFSILNLKLCSALTLINNINKPQSWHLLPNDYHGLIKPWWTMSPLGPKGITGLFWIPFSFKLLSETKGQVSVLIDSSINLPLFIWQHKMNTSIIRQAQIFTKNLVHPANLVYTVYFFGQCSWTCMFGSKWSMWTPDYELDISIKYEIAPLPKTTPHPPSL